MDCLDSTENNLTTMGDLFVITFLLHWLILQDTTAAAPPACQNNGTLKEGFCNCPANLEGKHCEYYKTSVTADTIAVATLVIIEFEGTYREEYKHPETTRYQEFAHNFATYMDKVYDSKVENYNGLNILKIRQGSVVVTHEVVVNITNGKTTTAVVKEIPKQIQEALSYAKSCRNGSEECSRMTILGTPFVDKPKFHPNLVCEQNIPKEFRSFYTAVQTSDMIICISQCETLHSKTKNCAAGTCRITSTGSTCQCEDTGYWFSGNDCHGRINRNAVFAVIGTAAGALVVTLVALAVCLVLKRQTFVRLNDSKDEQEPLIISHLGVLLSTVPIKVTGSYIQATDMVISAIFDHLILQSAVDNQDIILQYSYNATLFEALEDSR
ncbi:mucin-17-like isoform X1 [Arapaima gigas]